ncbi:ABC transporter ATP-binding protein [Cellulosimicrobium arenosum]|uniref:ABC transporter ATP-binding protein n=1 Tax=Cellulosimicrobium arenosum TaxID=2708133 RepID=A0A927G804_9MICO|nr:ABC transporter ATP-binding protein [Cellulosimicrobium arenosum]MBD8078583.1 ABC transporter ATP-binding protein [Cellulosimicrobium arenosum]
MGARTGAARGAGWRGRVGALVVATRLYHRAAPATVVARAATIAAAGLVPVAAAWLTKALVDGLGTGLTVRTTVLLAIGLAVTGALGAVLAHVARYLDQEIARRVSLHMQATLFGAVVRPTGIAQLEDPEYHDRLQLARLAGESGPVLLTAALVSVVQSLVTVSAFTVSLVVLSPLAAGLVLASAVPALVAQLRLGRLRSSTTALVSPRARRRLFYATLLTDLRTAKEIRLFGLGNHFRDRMLDEVGSVHAAERNVDRVTVRTETWLALLTAFVAGAVLVMTVLRIGAGVGTVGDLTLLVAALGAVQGSVAAIVGQVAVIDEALVLIGRYVEIVDDAAPSPHAPGSGPAAVAGPAGPAGPARPGPPPVPSATTGIRFEGVWFRYADDAPWVLRDLDLDIRPGSWVALVGANGAGKSTVVKLLCRLYEPTRGRITWDGTDVATLDPAVLRSRIATVFQDFVCYELTARENVALGDLRRAEQPGAVESAAEHAGVGDVLAALPRGYDTMLTRAFAGLPGDPVDEAADDDAPGDLPAHEPAGVVLSGGQWQRVAVARSLLREDAGLLVLDEPSSGLDPRAEAELQAMLRAVGRGRSTLLVAHRLSTVRDADRIVVLDDGTVLESGDHDALMDLDGEYAALFRLQAEGYRERATAGGAS